MRKKGNKKAKGKRKQKKHLSEDEKAAKRLNKTKVHKNVNLWVVDLKPPKGFNNPMPTHLRTKHFQKIGLSHATGYLGGYFGIVANTLYGGPSNIALNGSRTATTDGWTYTQGFGATDSPFFTSNLPLMYQKYQVISCKIQIDMDCQAAQDSLYLCVAPSYDTTFQTTNPFQKYSMGKASKVIEVSSSRDGPTKGRLIMKHNIADIAGLSGLTDMELISNYIYFGNGANAPTNKLGFHIIPWLRDGGNSVLLINMLISLEFEVLWFDQVNETS